MSHQLLFLFDEGNTLDELARSSKRASRFPEKCGRLPTPAYKKRCLVKDVPGGGQDQSKLPKCQSDSWIYNWIIARRGVMDSQWFGVEAYWIVMSLASNPGNGPATAADYRESSFATIDEEETLTLRAESWLAMKMMDSIDETWRHTLDSNLFSSLLHPDIWYDVADIF